MSTIDPRYDENPNASDEDELTAEDAVNAILGTGNLVRSPIEPATFEEFFALEEDDDEILAQQEARWELSDEELDVLAQLESNGFHLVGDSEILGRPEMLASDPTLPGEVYAF